jgi:hypothetical protein
MVRIGYPLADRGERLRAGHERCDGDREDSRQAVSDPRRLRGSGTVANSSKALTRTARADGLQAAGEVREDVIDGGPWLGGWLRHRHPSPKDHTSHTATLVSGQETPRWTPSRSTMPRPCPAGYPRTRASAALGAVPG